LTLTDKPLTRQDIGSREKAALLPLSPLQLLRSGERVALSVSEGPGEGLWQVRNSSDLERFTARNAWGEGDRRGTRRFSKGV